MQGTVIKALVYFQSEFTEHSQNTHVNSEGSTLFAYKGTQNLVEICWIQVEWPTIIAS
jgi:hypothetical protein